MTLKLDLSALTQNAALVKATATRNRLSAQLVLKAPFIDRQILDACRQGGIERAAVSSIPSLSRLKIQASASPSFIGLFRPADSDRVAVNCDASVHTNFQSALAVVMAAQSLGRQHDLWLAARTSEDREGLEAGPLLDLAHALELDPRTRGHTTGVLANWGCAIESIPAPTEIDALRKVKAAAERFANRALGISIGGSVLLPAVDNLGLPGEAGILRCGEAVLIGTIPGHDGAAIGLQRTTSLDTYVIEVAPRQSGARILVDQGAASLSPDDDALMLSWGTVDKIYSEMTSIDLSAGAPMPAIGDTVQISLGFESALRAFSNQNLRRLFTQLESRCELKGSRKSID